jgi:hypothetical protein
MKRKRLIVIQGKGAADEKRIVTNVWLYWVDTIAA